MENLARLGHNLRSKEYRNKERKRSASTAGLFCHWKIADFYHRLLWYSNNFFGKLKTLPHLGNPLLSKNSIISQVVVNNYIRDAKDAGLALLKYRIKRLNIGLLYELTSLSCFPYSLVSKFREGSIIFKNLIIRSHCHCRIPNQSGRLQKFRNFVTATPRFIKFRYFFRKRYRRNKVVWNGICSFYIPFSNKI